MTELRQRMIECLQLRGLSARTQASYVRAVRQLAEHYKKSPDLVTEEELRQYFLYIKNVKKYARPTTTIALCGIKFFIERTLGKQWTSFDLIRPPREKKLPVILLEEVARRFPGSRPRALGDLSREVPRPAQEDRVVRSGRRSGMEERVGGALRASGKWRSSIQVSSAIRVSGGDQQQPHTQTRRRRGDL